MANVFTQENTNYMVSIKPHLGLRGAIMSPSFKNTIEVGYLFALSEFGKKIAKLNWSGMRDTTKVIFTTAVLYAGDNNYTNIYKGTDVYTHIDNLRKDTDDVKRLFAYMGSGKGSAVKSILENFGNFKKLFKAIVGEGLNIEDYENDNKIDKIWQGYLNQMGKIKPWKLSAGTIEKHVLPILEASLKTPYYNAFKKGFESTKKSNTKIYDKLIQEALPNKCKPTNQITLSFNATPVNIALEVVDKGTSFRVDDTENTQDDFRQSNENRIFFKVPKSYLYELMYDANGGVKTAQDLRDKLKADMERSQEVKHDIIKTEILRAKNDVEKDLYHSQIYTDETAWKFMKQNPYTLITDPFTVTTTNPDKWQSHDYIYLIIEIEGAIGYYLESNVIDGTAIKNDLKGILKPLFDTISFINYPPKDDLQPPSDHSPVIFVHYSEITKGRRGRTRPDLARNTHAVTSDSRTIFYYKFADHSDAFTIYLFPRDILDLAKESQYDLNQVKQILIDKIDKVTKPQGEGIVSDEDEQQLQSY